MEYVIDFMTRWQEYRLSFVRIGRLAKTKKEKNVIVAIFLSLFRLSFIFHSALEHIHAHVHTHWQALVQNTNGHIYIHLSMYGNNIFVSSISNT